MDDTSFGHGHGMRRLICLLLALPTLASAFSPEAWIEEDRFGVWSVSCDSLDDMGGITYLDCAVSADGDVYFQVDGGAIIVAARPGTDVAGLTLAPCGDWLCSDSMDLDAVLVRMGLEDTQSDDLRLALARATQLLN